MKFRFFISFVAISTILLSPHISFGQMQRERANPGGAVDETFWAPNIAGLSTVEQLEAGMMNVTIMHNFGILTNRTLQDFFGLDITPNVRLGMDFGITDRWSVGIGRSSSEKVIDLRSKMAVLRQQKDDSIPFSLSLKGDVALTTAENNRPPEDDLSFLLSLPIARNFGDRLSLQATPMVSHFNSVNAALNRHNTLIAIGLGIEYELSKRFALISEYYPVLGERNPDTSNAFTLGVNIETGGHVFQPYLASSQWHTEQYIITHNDNRFWEGDFRIGFNVNRFFSL